MKFKEIQNDGQNAKVGMCKGYPKIPSIYVRDDKKGCFSAGLGMNTPKMRKKQIQAINLSVKCRKPGIVLHILGHSLGMAHE